MRAKVQTKTALLAYDEIGAGADFLEAGAVPEDAIDGALTGAICTREEDLKAVTRPLGVFAKQVGGSYRNEALCTDLV